MGVVDLAVGADGTEVALKRVALHGTAADMDVARQRIRREAEVLARLPHRAIVPLLDVVDEGDDVLLVMPYLAGGNLAERVAARGPLAPDQVLALADHLLGALVAAHRQGVVHRDIKPANVLFDSESRPYLADFGVASSRDVTLGLTAPNLVIGTPGYLAPEQARGESATAASDVFSLGATLFYAATAEPPFGHGEPAVILHRAASGKVEPLPRHLPVELRRRVGALLAVRPDRRPTAAAAGGGAEGTEVQGPSLASRRRRRTLTLAAATSGALAVAALAAAAVYVRRDDRASGAAAAPATTAVPTTLCETLPYQPCGQPAAPGTDGVACIDGRADYDRVLANGCEAVPDQLDGTQLDGELAANLVPADDVDEYPFVVGDHIQLTCNGTITVTLTAPKGVSMRLEVLRKGEVLGTAVSADGQPGATRIGDPSCLGDDSGTLVARVTSIGSDRSASDYTLTRTGSF
ncbi:MAG: eukaryotic-like serine/threonine-protein kinase [Acidimicrobiaceae bacterium]